MTDATDARVEHIDRIIAGLKVEPGSEVRLPDDFDPEYTPEWLAKDDAKDLLEEGIEILSELQDRLYSDDTHAVLLVLQAMDAAGKDGTIKHVMSGVNPQGVDVNSFKAPNAEEADHDFLWRPARRLPDKGRIGIFNRSYYEEVLVVRVHPEWLQAQKLPESSKGPDVWERRFTEINNWEKYLTDQGIRIVKVFLNVSKDEQARRFLDRIDDPSKNWKFSSGDVKERAYWDDYQQAYAEMLSATSTPWAPWYVVPADHKWFTRLATAAILGRTLIEIDPQYPPPDPDDVAVMAEQRAQLVDELAEDA